jgi:hypothetical protein
VPKRRPRALSLPTAGELGPLSRAVAGGKAEDSMAPGARLELDEVPRRAAPAELDEVDRGDGEGYNGTRDLSPGRAARPRKPAKPPPPCTLEGSEIAATVAAIFIAACGNARVPAPAPPTAHAPEPTAAPTAALTAVPTSVKTAEDVGREARAGPPLQGAGEVALAPPADAAADVSLAAHTPTSVLDAALTPPVPPPVPPPPMPAPP